MKTPVLIVSGFLGTGKTTFIRQFLAEFDNTERIMIIENDFGEVSFDAALLTQQGIRLQALTSGCICCTLAGDFEKSLHTVLAQADVDLIIIEPSGVGKLSDVLRVCRSAALQDRISVLPPVTIADAQRSLLYLHNFGEFFTDQIEHGQRIFLSHADENLLRAEESAAAIRKINPEASIYKTAWETISLKKLLLLPCQPAKKVQCIETVQEALCTDHDHDMHCDHHDHHHDAYHDFNAVTLRSETLRSGIEWKRRAVLMLNSAPGQVVRMKGILPTPEGFISLQYNGGNIVMEETDIVDQTFTIIGAGMDEKMLRRLWEQ